MFSNINIDNSINLALGATFIFLNIGINKNLQSSDKIDKCSKLNLNIGSAMGTVTGLLYLYKGIRN